MFHSVPRIESIQARVYDWEIRGATAILYLHTLEEIGIDITRLNENIYALSFMVEFLVKKPSQDPVRKKILERQDEADAIDPSDWFDIS